MSLLSCTRYCPHLPHSISRAWDCLIDPSLILLSVLIQGLSALSQYYKFDTRIPLVLVTSSESSSVIGPVGPITLALVAIIYCLTFFIGITLLRLIALAILLHPLRVLQFGLYISKALTLVRVAV